VQSSYLADVNGSIEGFYTFMRWRRALGCMSGSSRSLTGGTDLGPEIVVIHDLPVLRDDTVRQPEQRDAVQDDGTGCRHLAEKRVEMRAAADPAKPTLSASATTSAVSTRKSGMPARNQAAPRLKPATSSGTPLL